MNNEESLLETLPETTIAPYKPRSTLPKGRQKGVKNKLTLLREAVLTKQEHVILTELPKIIEVVCRKAQEGDLTAAKLILERIIPIRKQSDGDDSGSKGPPTINIVIEGSEGRKETRIIVESPKTPIDDAYFEEIEDNE